MVTSPELRHSLPAFDKLLPGHTLELNEAGELRIEPYWDLQFTRDEDSHPKSYYVRNYREMLEQAVSSHLMSDVPLGMFLSGGLDSSAVAALMTKLRREPIETFSVGYEEVPYSELSYARELSTHIKSLHHEVKVSRQAFFDALPKLIWHEDEPIVWPSSVALYFVAKLARERVTVVLTGEGSDETLAGYTRYAWTLWNTRLDRIYRALSPSGVRRALREVLAGSAWLSPGLRRRLQHTFLARTGPRGIRSISTISTQPFPKLSRPIYSVTSSDRFLAPPTGILWRAGRSVQETFSSGFFTATSRLIWWSCS